MNLATAASIGMGVLQHRQEIQTALGGLSGLGKLSGEGFSKIAQQFGLSKGASQSIAKAIDDGRNPNNTPGVQALLTLNYFDADKNGQVTRDELTQGLQKLNASGLASQGAYAKMANIGEKLLQNYDKVSALDGQAGGISYRDMGQLLQRDKNAATLSDADWQTLNA
jgi:hypothetical protein